MKTDRVGVEGKINPKSKGAPGRRNEMAPLLQGKSKKNKLPVAKERQTRLAERGGKEVSKGGGKDQFEEYQKEGVRAGRPQQQGSRDLCQQQNEEDPRENVCRREHKAWGNLAKEEEESLQPPNGHIRTAH